MSYLILSLLQKTRKKLQEITIPKIKTFKFKSTKGSFIKFYYNKKAWKYAFKTK